VTVIEFDLGDFYDVNTLRFKSLASESAVGILGVTAHVK